MPNAAHLLLHTGQLAQRAAAAQQLLASPAPFAHGSAG
jgi:hypothetical protein